MPPKITLDDVQRLGPNDLIPMWPTILRDFAERPSSGAQDSPIASARAARRRLIAMPAAAAALIEQYRSDRLALEKRRDIFGQARDKARRELREKTLLEHAALKADFEAARRSLLDGVRKARHARAPMTVAELAGWDRLRAAIAGSPNPEVAAIKRLQRAQSDGDKALLVGAAYMLADYLISVGHLLLGPDLDWLDVIAGDESTAAAVALEVESRNGLQWVETTVNYAGYEIQSDSNVTVLPDYAGEMIRLDGAPDFELTARQAEAAAGVRR